MEAFIPLFRQNLLPQLGGGIGDRLARTLAAFQPESITQVPVIDVLIFFPAGLLLTVALIESGIPTAIATILAILVAFIIYPIVEIAHGVADLPIILGAVLTHVFAASVGAIVAANGIRPFNRKFSVRERARLVAMAYSVLIMVWSWRPFRLDYSASSMAEQFTGSHIIPLQALAERTDLFSVTDVISQGVIFFPLGALLAVWPLRRKGPLSGLLPAIYLAIVLEVAKIPIAERFMDVTHILIQSAGAALGFLLIRRVGYKVHGSMLRDN
jgi:glycopeptide antibiotics resistance protein